jgi:hypothetical protein
LRSGISRLDIPTADAGKWSDSKLRPAAGNFPEWQPETLQFCLMIVLMWAGTWAGEFSAPWPRTTEPRPRAVEIAMIKQALYFILVLLPNGF